MMKMAPIFLVALIMAATIKTTAGQACATDDLSFIIIMDSSSSVSEAEWQNEKDFVKNFVSQTPLGSNAGVRIGVVNYGFEAEIVATCSSANTASVTAFNAFIDALPRKQGGTAIHDSLSKADQLLSTTADGCGRAGEKQYVLLLTDGTENVEMDTAVATALEQRLRAQAAIHAISIGSGTNIADLQRITGNSAYVSQYDTFLALSEDNAAQIYLNLANRQCAVGGRWAAWGVYGACSVSCGGGSRTRTRLCLNPVTNVGQTDCTNYPSGGSESTSCNDGSCPAYGQWSEYGTCSETCQSNTQVSPFQTRTRVCNGGAFNGPCIGAASENRDCNVGVSCPGTLTQWTGFGACSASCQLSITAPTQQRTRQCNSATFGGNCDGASLADDRDCNVEVPCPGVLSQWSVFGVCSEECQSNQNVQPTRFRTRTCTEFSFGGNCNGASLTDIATCNVGVGCTGNWGQWGTFGTCSETCQSNAQTAPFQTQSRTCLGGTFGAGCTGSSTNTQNCNANVMCPGTLTQWTGFGTCSATCQLGVSAPIQQRTRQCTGATFGGNCGGATLTESTDCSVEVSCPGDLSQWGEYGACSESCQSDVSQVPTQTRSRTCTSASFGGNCGGAVLTSSRQCNAGVGCVGAWSQWGAFGTCSETCHSNVQVPPFQTQFRTCQGGTFNAGCVGSATENQNCNVNVICPGTLTQWTGYGTCSATCQLGISAPTQQRTRQCNGATFGGNCGGLSVSESRDCNVEVQCPGDLSQWTAWSACPSTCQTGATAPRQFRSRTCTMTSFGGNCGAVSLSGEQTCVANVACPGILTEWSAYTACTATCQQGNVSPTRRRTRLCQTATLGANCGGAALEDVTNCNFQVGCPGTIQNWGPWTTCSETCQSNPLQTPKRSRVRFCLDSSFDGNCFGVDLQEDEDCSAAVVCPMPSSWNQWGNYSTCSKTCDTGSQTRSRTCNEGIPPTSCAGIATESRDCKIVDCPRECPISKKCNCSTVTQYPTAPAINQFAITTTEIMNAANVMTYWTEAIQRQACESCMITRLQTSVNVVNQHIAQVKNVRDRLREIKKTLRDVINCNSQIAITTNLWSLYDWIWERCVLFDGISVELAACKMRFNAALNSCQSYSWLHQFYRQMTRKF